MNFKRFTTVLRAGALAALFVVGTSGKASAALLIDFDNLVFDGGQINALAGGNYSGSGIIFDSIFLKDSTCTASVTRNEQRYATPPGGLFVYTASISVNAVLKS